MAGGEVIFLTNDVMSTQLYHRLCLMELYYGRQLTITSAWRSGQDNFHAGGLADSLHLVGRAVDLRTRGEDADRMLSAAARAGFEPVEIEVEKDHLHLELEERKPL